MVKDPYAEEIIPCVKCNSELGWDGPTYYCHESGGIGTPIYFSEGLKYRCRICGYTRVEEPKDAVKRPLFIVEDSPRVAWWRRLWVKLLIVTILGALLGIVQAVP